MDRLRNNDMLGANKIPFAQEVLGKLLDFGNLVHDLLLIDDKGTADTADDAGRLLAKVTGIDPNNFVAAFGTAQELGARLNALGILTLQGGKFGKYDGTTQQLTYQIGLEQIFLNQDIPVDFNLGLPPLASISSQSKIRLGATGHLDAMLGVQMGNSAAAITNATALSSLNGADKTIKTGLALTGAEDASTVFGRLSGDASFTVTIAKTDNSIVTANVLVPKSATATNNSVDDH